LILSENTYCQVVFSCRLLAVSSDRVRRIRMAEAYRHARDLGQDPKAAGEFAVYREHNHAATAVHAAFKDWLKTR
jgi:hypothetical protein